MPIQLQLAVSEALLSAHQWHRWCFEPFLPEALWPLVSVGIFGGGYPSSCSSRKAPSCTLCLQEAPPNKFEKTTPLTGQKNTQAIYNLVTSDPQKSVLALHFIFCHFHGWTQSPININNSSGLLRERVGVKLFLGKRDKQINIIPENLSKRPGQSRESPVMILGQFRDKFFMCFLYFSDSNLELVVITKPVGRMSFLGEIDLPGMVPGVLPRTPILHFKTSACRLVAPVFQWLCNEETACQECFDLCLEDVLAGGGSTTSYLQHSFPHRQMPEIWKRGHWRRGICMKLSEIMPLFR